MQIYVNNQRWISPDASNAKYPYTDMEVGDEATIVPRGNVSPIDLHQLDHSVRSSVNGARYSKTKEGKAYPSDGKAFTTKKIYLTSVGINSIKDRPAFTVKRLR